MFNRVWDSLSLEEREEVREKREEWASTFAGGSHSSAVYLPGGVRSGRST